MFRPGKVDSLFLITHFNLDNYSRSHAWRALQLRGGRVLVNPRRACAARVTSSWYMVCLSVCRRLFSHYRLRGGL